MSLRRHARIAIKHLWFQLLLRSGATARARRSLTQQGASIVVTFHRVLSAEQLRSTNSPDGMVIEESTFVHLLEYLSTRVSFGSLAEPAACAQRLRCFITFDDGWQDNFDVAVPHLISSGVPATIFVCPERAGRHRPFWPETAIAAARAAERDLASHELFRDALLRHGIQLTSNTQDELLSALKRLSAAARTELLDSLSCSLPLIHFSSDCTMGWDELKQLAAAGVTIANHTAHHEILTNLPAADQTAELLQASRRLKEELGQPCTLFSYPNGDWNLAVRARVAEAGITHAFINSPGAWTAETDPLLIPRLNLSEQRLIGISGRFSAASAEYFLFWLPYQLEKRRRRAEVNGNAGPRPADLRSHALPASSDAASKNFIQQYEALC